MRGDTVGGIVDDTVTPSEVVSPLPPTTQCQLNVSVIVLNMWQCVLLQWQLQKTVINKM